MKDDYLIITLRQNGETTQLDIESRLSHHHASQIAIGYFAALGSCCQGHTLAQILAIAAGNDPEPGTIAAAIAKTTEKPHEDEPQGLPL